MDDEEVCEVLSAVALILIGYILARRNRLRRRNRRWWVHPMNDRRLQQGDGVHLIRELTHYHDRHQAYFRLSPSELEELLSLVGPHLRKQDAVRQSVHPKERLAITLRRLASGDSPQSLAFAYRRGVSTVRGIVYETCAVLWSVLQPLFMNAPTSEADWISIADAFFDRWNFPNLLGALDGKHVTIQAPANTGSEFFNYKKNFSIILMALCDADYKFTMIDCGEAGRWSDGGVWEHSSIKARLEATLPHDRPLPNTDNSEPFCIVADEAFPLKPWLLRPYPGKQLTTLHRKVYNMRLSRARRTIENAFGIMVSRWRILRSPIIAEPDVAQQIVNACCILHNYMREKVASTYTPGGFTDTINPSSGEVVEGLWRDSPPAERPHQPLRSRNSSLEAKRVREAYVQWISSPAGSIPGQESYVERTS